MERVYNFSAGPSMLPVPVLEQAQKDLVNYPGAGCSVMEMSHRSKMYEAIIEEAEADFRAAAEIPDSYTVLFLQGGASLQFSMVPMNLTKQGETTNYAVTGNFAGKAYEEGKRWGNAVCVASSKQEKYNHIPKITPEMLSPDAKYLHITGNNTIFGSCYNTLPQTGGVPLVCDWSSAILGKRFDINDYALVYAGAQKNMGPAGLTMVILKNELLENEIDPIVPSMLNYKLMADAKSMYNTPPCFSIYVAGLVFKWVREQGGVAALEKRNTEKAQLLYDVLDASKIFTALVAKEDRSIMNVTFTLPTKEQNDEFLAMAKGRGMINLAGHRISGGCRASIYNAMPAEGVKALCECIEDYEAGKRV